MHFQTRLHSHEVVQTPFSRSQRRKILSLADKRSLIRISGRHPTPKQTPYFCKALYSDEEGEGEEEYLEVIGDDSSEKKAGDLLETEVGTYQVIDTEPSTSYSADDDSSQGVLFKAAILGGALLALAGFAFFIRKKLQSGQLGGLGGMKEVLDHRKLQKESEQRLGSFIEELRSENSANLSAKNLGDEGTAYIAEALAFNDRCRNADLSKNGIGLKGVTQLCQALSQNEFLETLTLDTNSLGDEGAELLAKVIATNTGMTSLNLSSNNIGDKGATVLAEALKMNTTLTRLDLSQNAIDQSGTAVIAEALKGNSALESLSINDNYVGEEGAKLIADALSENTHITELSISSNDLGDAGVKLICEALAKRSTRLKSLNLGKNNLTAEGVEPLVQLLKKAKISDLTLYMNDLGDAGITRIAKALEGSDSLESLDVNGNNIGPLGMVALTEGLKGNENLRSLEVSYNPIGHQGAKSLIDVLKFELKLEHLKMGWCTLGKTDGANAVADLIMYNTTLRTLDVRGNGFENNGAILLSRALKEHSNEHLQELDLGYNEIRDEGACQIAQALKSNPNNAPVTLKVNSNYIGNFGQTALVEALDIVYELSGNREMNITF